MGTLLQNSNHLHPILLVPQAWESCWREDRMATWETNPAASSHHITKSAPIFTLNKVYRFYLLFNMNLIPGALFLLPSNKEKLKSQVRIKWGISSEWHKLWTYGMRYLAFINTWGDASSCHPLPQVTLANLGHGINNRFQWNYIIYYHKYTMENKSLKRIL